MSVHAREGRHDQPVTGGLPVSFIAWSGAAFYAALLIGSFALVTGARGQPADIYLELFNAQRGDLTFARFARVGPYRDAAICYATAAITLDALNTVHADKDFRGRCDGGILLSMREVADRALALLPEQIK